MDKILSSLEASKANHPVVVGLGSRGDLSHVFLVIEGHAVPVTKGIVAAVDRQLKLFFVMQCRYPDECSHIFLFLQRAYAIADDTPLPRGVINLQTHIHSNRDSEIS